MFECRWCKVKTNNEDFQCENCWEMFRRIEWRPDLAALMLAEILEGNYGKKIPR